MLHAGQRRSVTRALLALEDRASSQPWRAKRSRRGYPFAKWKIACAVDERPSGGRG
jgi:hypothetical protein